MKRYTPKMNNTKIEWTDRRWNPITGCTPISEGCQNCYARRIAQRLAGRYGYPANDPFRVIFHPDRLDLPLHWRKPSKIFVNSMGDLFHEDVRYSDLEKVFEKIFIYHKHTFQVLTKRPRTALMFLDSNVRSDVFKNWPFQNCWFGVTVESADWKGRINLLRRIPAAVRFISFEPLLGDVGELDLTGIHWVIVGGETGPGARIMEPLWVSRIERQCDAVHVPFFFKKWGPHWNNLSAIASDSTSRRREFPNRNNRNWRTCDPNKKPSRRDNL